MKKDWAYLAKLTGSKPVTIEKVTIDNEDLAIEGHFELPPLAKLSPDDQVFVAVFIKSHGSIKQMESYFGVSYPSIKSRLKKISDQLDFIAVETVSDGHDDVLEMLDRGDIDVDKAIELIRKEKEK